MGQKVHPLGFRVGITKKHQSQWFARFQKYGYSQSVLEDHLLRQTLQNLFKNLQTETVQSNVKSQKKGQKQPAPPKITQIKIERGLIPYEIGIQIHADDCLAVTKAIDNLKINKNLVNNLQKTRKYLFKASTQLKTDSIQQLLDKENTQELQTNTVENNVTSLGENSKNTKKRICKFSNLKKKQNKRRKFTTFKKRKKLSKATFMRLRALKRRFKKRQKIQKRYRQLILKGLVIRKQGNLILRKISIKKKNKKSALNLKYNKKGLTANAQRKGVKTPQQSSVGVTKTTKKETRSKINSFTTRMYKKFAGLFLTKMNKQFLVQLKNIMKYWHTQITAKKQAPLGYSKKWGASAKCNALTNKLKNKYNLKVLGYSQIEKLTKLIDLLERKSLIKMEALRKDFITFGTLSKTRAFGYYQIIFFLKRLKEIVNKTKKQNILNNKKNVNSRKLVPSLTSNSSLVQFKEKVKSVIRAKSKQKKSISQKILNKYKNLSDNSQLMANECRKIKLISYLKDVVTKHRTENIFYYLATIADARKDLKKLKLYIKKHANFLFGINNENNKENVQILMQKVTKALTQADSIKEQKAEGLSALQKSFLTFINDQRKMAKANLALTPKISIKFFSVKTTDILEKASVVADSIVDALEKRKAFRGVIKKAKENLMRRSRVKGVKIQVAGRLNGAEIARSEWVRAGRVPLQTLRANIDYSYRTANTIYGIIGVKVWIFKGYSKIN